MGARRPVRLEQAEVSDMMPVSECDEVEKDPAIMQLPPHDFELRTQGEAAAFSGRNSPPLRFLSDDHLNLVGRKSHAHRLSTGSGEGGLQIFFVLRFYDRRGETC